MTGRERHSPVYRQLEAYRESWKKNHDEAMLCRDWEDAIAVGINIFGMLQEREQAWYERVFRGVVSFDPEDDRDYRERFSVWLETTEAVLANVLPSLEIRFGVVEGAEELRRCVERAKEILLHWQPPRLSAAVGLREMTLSPEAATELDRILDEANRQPPEAPSGSPMCVLSAEEFLRLKRSNPH